MEAAGALRRLVAGQRIDSYRCQEILAGLRALPAENFTAYEAAYIALAVATNSVLYTSDEKLRKGHRARVALFTG